MNIGETKYCFFNIVILETKICESFLQNTNNIKITAENILNINLHNIRFIKVYLSKILLLTIVLGNSKMFH